MVFYSPFGILFLLLKLSSLSLITRWLFVDFVFFEGSKGGECSRIGSILAIRLVSVSCLSVCLSVYPSSECVYLSVCLSVRVCLCVYLSVCLSVCPCLYVLTILVVSESVCVAHLVKFPECSIFCRRRSRRQLLILDCISSPRSCLRGSTRGWWRRETERT